MLAARADLPLDRLDDAVLVADVVASRASAYAPGDGATCACTRATARCGCASARCEPGGAQALLGETAVPDVGSVILKLADEVHVDTDEPGASTCVCASPTTGSAEPVMAIEFSASDEQVDDTTHVVAVRGEIDIFTAPGVQGAHRRRHRRRPRPRGRRPHARTTFIDSSSLGVLISAHRRLSGRDGRLIIACDVPAVLNTFKITGLDAVLEIVAEPRRGARRSRRSGAGQAAA